MSTSTRAAEQESERALSAHHEAGHAVAAYLLIGPEHVERVALDPSPLPGMPELAGVTTIVRFDRGSASYGWQALAGPVAQQITAEANGWRCLPSNEFLLAEGCALDLRAVHHAFGFAEGLAAGVASWRVDAIRAWLQSPEVWPHIEKLARELLSRGDINGAELREVLSATDVGRCVSVARTMHIAEDLLRLRAGLVLFLGDHPGTDGRHSVVSVSRDDRGEPVAVNCACGGSVPLPAGVEVDNV